jgi:hypothetical protein
MAENQSEGDSARRNAAFDNVALASILQERVFSLGEVKSSHLPEAEILG